MAPSVMRRLTEGFSNLLRRDVKPSEIRQLEEEIYKRNLQLQGRMQSKLLREADGFGGPNWIGGVVDPYEPLYDDPEFYAPMWGVERLPPTLNKTLHGDLIPVYITWYGLKVIRDVSRKICVQNEFAIGAVENRCNYICGKGYQHKLVPKNGKENAETKYLCALGQRWIDSFMSHQRWNEREQEVVKRCDRDGECFLRFFHVGRGCTEVRFVEPEWVQSPADNDWDSYGIVNQVGDIEDVLGYWIYTYPPYQKAEYIDAREVLHIKINSDSTSKRGLPTFYPIRKNLERAEKLLRNMSILAQVQATFAMVRKHKQYSVAAMQQFQQSNADIQYTSPWGGTTKYGKGYAPGTVLDIPENTDLEFPSASVNAGNLVSILQAELQAAGQRVNMPTYMFSGDVSGANMACHDDMTEVLTKDGFKKWVDLQEGEEIGTTNPVTGLLEFQCPSQIHKYRYDGDLVWFRGTNNLDIAVTPNHRMWVNVRGAGWKFVEAGAMNLASSYTIPFTATGFKGQTPENFGLPTIGHAYAGRRCWPGAMRQIPMKLWLRFLGYFLAEGWTVKQKHTVSLSQMPGELAVKMERTIVAIGRYLGGKVQRQLRPNGSINWHLHDKSLYEWMVVNCGQYSHTKKMPSFVYTLDGELLKVLLRAMVAGDGSIRKSGSREYFTTSVELANAVQQLGIRAGYISHMRKPMVPAKVLSLPTLKPGKEYRRIHAVTLRLAKWQSGISVRKHKKTLEYHGDVWCVTVPNGLVITRRRGKVAVTGNSTFIAESPFVKCMERAQSFYAVRFGDGSLVSVKNSGAMWRVLANAVDYGGLPKDVLTDCELIVEGPTLIVRDKAQETQRAAMLNQAGRLSGATWSKWEGTDDEQEVKQWQEEQVRNTLFQAQLQKLQAQAQIEVQQMQAQAQMQMQQQAMAQQQAAAAQMGAVPGAAGTTQPGQPPAQGAQQAPGALPPGAPGAGAGPMPGMPQPEMMQRDLVNTPQSDSGFISRQGGDVRDLLGLESVTEAEKARLYETEEVKALHRLFEEVSNAA